MSFEATKPRSHETENRFSNESVLVVKVEDRWLRSFVASRLL